MSSNPLNILAQQQQQQQQLSEEEERLLLQKDEQQQLKMMPAGLYTALSHFLRADDGGLHAWIVDSQDGAPPVRQKHTALLNELAIGHLYGELYEQCLDIEAEATWYYVDQLACRACQLSRIKNDELRGKQIVTHIAAERRQLEEQEQAIRSTLEESYLQSLRLDARDMKTKRSLLSTTEYKQQLDRVSRHVDSILTGVL